MRNAAILITTFLSYMLCDLYWFAIQFWKWTAFTKWADNYFNKNCFL